MATNLEFIKNITSTEEVSSLNLDNIFSSKYDVYCITCRNIDVVTGGLYPDLAWRYLKASDGSVDSTANYDYANLGMALIGTFTQNKNTNQTRFYHQYNHTDEKASGGFIMYVYNPFSSTYTFASGQSGQYYNGDRYQAGWKGISVHTVEQSNSGIQLATGTAYANINVYGVT